MLFTFLNLNYNSFLCILNFFDDDFFLKKKMEIENLKPKRKELDDETRGQIIGLSKANMSERKINKILGIPKSTIHDTLVRFEKTNTTSCVPRPGRSLLIDKKKEVILKKIIKKKPRITLAEIQQNFQNKTSIQVSQKTIRNSLHNLGFSSCIPARKPLLNDLQKENRLNWCLERQSWSIRKWQNIIWSDESRFAVFNNDGPTRVWRLPRERFNEENLMPTVKHNGGSIMVWSCFSGRGLGPLVLVEGTIDRWGYIEILEKNLLPYIDDKFNGKGYHFQDDNATVHTAKAVVDWFQENEIKILENWPSQSPDLNPIEHLWAELEKRIKKLKKKPKNKKELFKVLQKEWKDIGKEFYKKLISSMPRRVRDCIDNNGGATKY